MNVLIAGAGNVGRYLAHILVSSGHSITLVEVDEARLDRAREESGATVVAGDATEPSLLEQCGIRAMQVVVAATGDDEDNLVIANLAKFEYGVPRVVGRVKNAANAWLYEPDMGVDVLVSAPHTIARLIEEQVAVGDVVQLLELAHGRAAVVEATLPDDSPVAGREPSSVAWPPDCVPAAVVRGAQVLLPGADLVLAPGDRLLCIADPAQLEPLHRLLGRP
jgi:trk/ktr system potassium uptake protein